MCEEDIHLRRFLCFSLPVCSCASTSPSGPQRTCEGASHPTGQDDRSLANARSFLSELVMERHEEPPFAVPSFLCALRKMHAGGRRLVQRSGKRFKAGLRDLSVLTCRDECARRFPQMEWKGRCLVSLGMGREISLPSCPPCRDPVPMPRALPNDAKLNLWAKTMRTTAASERKRGGVILVCVLPRRRKVMLFWPAAPV